MKIILSYHLKLTPVPAGLKKILEDRFGNLRLRCYAVVSLGFERIWGREVSDNIN